MAIPFKMLPAVTPLDPPFKANKIANIYIVTARRVFLHKPCFSIHSVLVVKNAKKKIPGIYAS